MSFPTKEDRTVCWENRDLYWNCLDEKKSEDLCKEFRKKYEKLCPSQWVKHFDRKREYLIFKDRLEKEGIVKDNENKDLCSSDLTPRRRSFYTFPSPRPNI
ncbi:cytochrome c oxidase assembly factor 6 homolog [Copidosoma floridanum]|uniref:cytochrome c oxidase assembly factor 6 homolog n=1 Tax=Copidosoma floridanum TaxID=29053 RepID=UPI0006C9B717|nr:cytochrome c oxidase assembly factor 6 homolog [Copidosoma floridanum]XP_014217857.1 cytochrome c oxidase assembly factor 6 homolog [Copidosoma floridanum]